MSSRPNRLPPARRRAKLGRCPECGRYRSNMARHVGREHPEWTLHRYSGGFYVSRVLMRLDAAPIEWSTA